MRRYLRVVVQGDMAELETSPLPTADTVSGEAQDDKDPEVEYLKKQFSLLMYRLRQMPNAVGSRLRGRFALTMMSQPWTMETCHGPLAFVALGKGPAGRANSLLTKQPSTIAWIDSFEPNSVFWDVGANVGVYTLYAARRGDTSVVAFEPAAVNYYMLAANCEINGFDECVTCLLMGLGQGNSIEKLEVSQFDAGLSFSFRGKRGRPIAGRQAAMVMSMDRLVADYGLACPNYIKIDVPGLTDEIVAGGMQLLRNPAVRQLHIECGLQSKGGRRIAEMLATLGFTPTGIVSDTGGADITFARAA
jgi:FkbM family methyltransferase